MVVGSYKWDISKNLLLTPYRKKLKNWRRTLTNFKVLDRDKLNEKHRERWDLFNGRKIGENGFFEKTCSISPKLQITPDYIQTRSDLY